MSLSLRLKTEGHINALTGLRAVAAGMVVCIHLIPLESPVILASLLHEFNVGVTIFFVLSGFLITYRYYQTITESKGWFSSYMINRIARVYPMYFLLTTITFLFAFISKPDFSFNILKEYVLNITLLRGFFSDYVYSGIAQGWTLTVEECFYFSAPLIFLLSKRINVLIQAAVVFLLGYLIYLALKDTNFHGFMNKVPYIYITTYFGRVFEFMIGVFMALLAMKDKQIDHSTRKGLIVFLLILGIQVAIHLYTQTFSIENIYGFFLNVLFLPAAVGLFIYGLTKEDSKIKTFLGTKFMVLLGKSSYTLYLFHWGVTSYLIRKYISDQLVVEILVTYIGSIILWYSIEEPANQLIRKIGIKYYTTKSDAILN